MSVKVHEAFSIDSFQDRLLWWDDFLGDQVKDEWRGSGDGGGSDAVVDAQTGGIVRLQTGGTSGNIWVLDWTNIRTLLVSKKLSAELRLKLTQTANTLASIELRADGTHLIRFVYDASASANWFIETDDGTGPTSADSGIAADTDYHLLRIECFPTGEVHFYIDGVETTNSPITADIPTQYLEVQLSITTQENAQKSMDIDYVVVRQEI